MVTEEIILKPLPVVALIEIGMSIDPLLREFVKEQPIGCPMLGFRKRTSSPRRGGLTTLSIWQAGNGATMWADVQPVGFLTTAQHRNGHVVKPR